jgi:hypothetical protein
VDGLGLERGWRGMDPFGDRKRPLIAYVLEKYIPEGVDILEMGRAPGGRPRHCSRRRVIWRGRHPRRLAE